jgi:hypothetical protein
MAGGVTWYAASSESSESLLGFEVVMIEYPCPSCDDDGPHIVLEDGEDSLLVSCYRCHVEFDVTELYQPVKR